MQICAMDQLHRMVHVPYFCTFYHQYIIFFKKRQERNATSYLAKRKKCDILYAERKGLHRKAVGMRKRLGLYVHIPFCRRKCLYCDFCSRPNPDEEIMRLYANFLCGDLIRASEQCRDYTVDTVFFGGGTPTLLPIDALTGFWIRSRGITAYPRTLRSPPSAIPQRGEPRIFRRCAKADLTD